MLDAIGAESIEDLYAAIPEQLRFRGQMDLPAPLLSEFELRQHVEDILGRNRSCRELLSFRGAGQRWTSATARPVRRLQIGQLG
jgi:glycine dehydrogenase subunit 1